MDDNLWNIKIREAYDNLDLSGFNDLMDRVLNKLNELIGEEEISIKTIDDEYHLIYSSNYFYELSFEIWKTVKSNRKISFKQFKALSSFCRINWIKEYDSKIEFKQF